MYYRYCPYSNEQFVVNTNKREGAYSINGCFTSRRSKAFFLIELTQQFS